MEQVRWQEMGGCTGGKQGNGKLRVRWQEMAEARWYEASEVAGEGSRAEGMSGQWGPGSGKECKE